MYSCVRKKCSLNEYVFFHIMFFIVLMQTFIKPDNLSLITSIKVCHYNIQNNYHNKSRINCQNVVFLLSTKSSFFSSGVICVGKRFISTKSISITYNT